MSELDALEQQKEVLAGVKPPLRLVLERQFLRINTIQMEDTLSLSAQVLDLAMRLNGHNLTGSIRLERIDEQIGATLPVLRIDIGVMSLFEEQDGLSALVPGSEIGFRTYHLELTESATSRSDYRLLLFSQETEIGEVNETQLMIMNSRTGAVDFSQVQMFQDHEQLLLEEIISSSALFMSPWRNQNARALLDIHPDRVHYHVSRGWLPWQNDTVKADILEEV